jgi:hypothetical protein
MVIDRTSFYNQIKKDPGLSIFMMKVMAEREKIMLANLMERQ